MFFRELWVTKLSKVKGTLRGMNRRNIRQNLFVDQILIDK